MAPSVAEAKVDGITEKLAETKIPISTKNGGEEAEVDSEDEEEPQANGNGNGATASASKKKKKKKSGAQKKKAKKAPSQQTDPPSIGLTKLFLNGCYPVGEEVEYDTSKFLDE